MSREEELLRSYVAHLVTLGASKSKWVQWVVRNGRARLEHITGESFETLFNRFNPVGDSKDGYK